MCYFCVSSCANSLIYKHTWETEKQIICVKTDRKRHSNLQNRSLANTVYGYSMEVEVV